MMDAVKNSLCWLRILLFASEMLAVHLGEIFSLVVYLNLVAITLINIYLGILLSFFFNFFFLNVAITCMKFS